MRVVRTKAEKPYNSSARQPKDAKIPEFSWDGVPAIGNTGFWYPTKELMFRAGYVTSATTGTADGVYSVLKREFMNPNPVELLSFTLPADKYKNVFYFNNELDPKILSPYESIFITVWTNSGHEDVVVQLVGDYL